MPDVAFHPHLDILLQLVAIQQRMGRCQMLILVWKWICHMVSQMGSNVLDDLLSLPSYTWKQQTVTKFLYLSTETLQCHIAEGNNLFRIVCIVAVTFIYNYYPSLDSVVLKNIGLLCDTYSLLYLLFSLQFSSHKSFSESS